MKFEQKIELNFILETSWEIALQNCFCYEYTNTKSSAPSRILGEKLFQSAVSIKIN